MINTTDDILDRISAILDDIKKADANNDTGLITQIRLDILSLLEDTVKYYTQRAFTLWAKDNLATAVSDVNWNITRGKPSTFMLTACLVSIEKAIVDEEEISPTYPHNKKRAAEIEKLEPDDFINTIKKLKPYANVYDE